MLYSIDRCIIYSQYNGISTRRSKNVIGISLCRSSTIPKFPQAAYDAIGLTGVMLSEGPANIAVTLKTPKGIVTLQSHGI